MAFGGGEYRGVLEDHAAAEHRDLLQLGLFEGGDGGVEAGGDDPLVFAEQIVGVFVEIADPADAGGAGDEVIALGGQVGQELDVLGVALTKRYLGSFW
jgi:hypothetical protein